MTMQPTSRWLGALAVMALVALGGGQAIRAQEATPVAAGGEATTPRPAHIHSGDCVNLGEVVAPLTNLTEPTGNAVGQSDKAIAAESSFTTVPMTLDQILASPHAVNVHLSAEQIGTYIACGEIGGVIDANGALTIGLRELNNSGYTGIAYLAPTAAGTGTTVSVFIAPTQGQGQGQRAGQAAATPVGGPAASPTAATTVRLAQKSGLGQYFTDANGRALYVFKQDTANTSACTGPCAATWPPFTATGTLTLPSGVGGTLGTITRPDGTTQVTYNGMPLYHFAKDTDAEDTYGQGVGGVWFVAQPQSA
jgi:predicted lipoprotein with Yx(FWY)xxD motif